MQKRNIVIATLTFIMIGCNSTPPETKYPNLPLTENALSASKWSSLNRFAARYPVQAARISEEGCATIEYVIRPDYSIEDIRVVSATRQYFADSAKAVLLKWNWTELPKGILAEPVKTQTRFDFCLDQPNQACRELEPEYSCPSEDIVYSSGTIVKRTYLR